MLRIMAISFPTMLPALAGPSGACEGNRAMRPGPGPDFDTLVQRIIPPPPKANFRLSYRLLCNAIPSYPLSFHSFVISKIHSIPLL